MYNRVYTMKVDLSAFKFDWDTGNTGKNKRHRVEDWECEEVFFDQGKVALKDQLHSGNEIRYIMLGKTKQARLLYLVYTTREGRIRIISARDCKKRKERDLYEKAT
jgi:uncharacterized DUF497 family protein